MENNIEKGNSCEYYLGYYKYHNCFVLTYVCFKGNERLDFSFGGQEKE